MHVVGFVSELNPFHNGHAYFTEQLRHAGDTYVVTVMSGNFVQRGEAAFTDKYLRAEAAVRSGVDLVLELPVPWALGGAESFACGGVSLLKSFGCDALAFGCETDDTALLQHTADCMHRSDIQITVAQKRKSGSSYPVAVAQTLREAGEADAARVWSSLF